MKSTASRVPGGQVVLDVEVSPDDMAPDIEQAFRRLARQVRIPGFRQGKAPAAIVERAVGRERVLQEALDAVVNRAYRTALDEQSLVPVDQPQVEVQSFSEGEPLRFQARVTVRPEVRLGDYRAIRIPREEVPVEAADVDRAIEELRAFRGTWLPVEDGPVAEGNLVILQTAGQVDDGRSIAEDRVEGVVGSGQLRGEIDAAVRGLSPGGSAEVELAFGQGDANRSLAGHSAHASVTVLEVKRLEPAALDDAFAAEVAPGSSLEALREDIGRRLQATADRQAERAVAEKALAAAVDGAEVEVPEVLVGRGVDNLLAELEAELGRAGTTMAAHLEAQGKTLEELRADLGSAAQRRVKVELVVDAIAADAGLVPSRRDMDDEIARLARGARASLADFRKMALQAENWGAIRFGLAERRVLQMLAEIAAGTDPAEAAAHATAAERAGPAAGPSSGEGPGAPGEGAAAIPGNPLLGAAPGDGPADGEDGRA